MNEGIWYEIACLGTFISIMTIIALIIIIIVDKARYHRKDIKNRLFTFIAKEEGIKEKVNEILPKEDRLLEEVKALYEKAAKLSEDNTELKRELDLKCQEIMARDGKIEHL